MFRFTFTFFSHFYIYIYIYQSDQAKRKLQWCFVYAYMYQHTILWNKLDFVEQIRVCFTMNIFEIHMHTCRSFPTSANAKNIDGRLDKKKRKIMHIWNRLHVFLRSIYYLAEHSTLISQEIRIFLLYT